MVTRIDFTPASDDETGKVLLELKANAKGSTVILSVGIPGSDIAGRTPGEILAAKGFLRETSALMAADDTICARHLDWRARYGKQFSGRGTGFYTEDRTLPIATQTSRDWRVWPPSTAGTSRCSRRWRSPGAVPPDLGTAAGARVGRDRSS